MTIKPTITAKYRTSCYGFDCPQVHIFETKDGTIFCTKQNIKIDNLDNGAGYIYEVDRKDVFNGEGVDEIIAEQIRLDNFYAKLWS